MIVTLYTRIHSTNPNFDKEILVLFKNVEYYPRVGEMVEPKSAGIPQEFWEDYLEVENVYHDYAHKKVDVHLQDISLNDWSFPEEAEKFKDWASNQ